MKIKLVIYLTQKTAAAFAPVRDSLQAVLPMVEAVPGGALSPDRRSFDTFRKQYDPVYMLEQMPSSPDDCLGLWITAEDLFAPGKLFIFGAAGERKAIVSAYPLKSKEAVGNVAVHEVCHMLGLAHCSGPCIMTPAGSAEDAEKRPLRLCRPCRAKILKRIAERAVNTYLKKPPRHTPLPAVSVSDQR